MRRCYCNAEALISLRIELLPGSYLPIITSESPTSNLNNYVPSSHIVIFFQEHVVSFFPLNGFVPLPSLLLSFCIPRLAEMTSLNDVL